MNQRSTKLVGAIADALPNRTLHAWERCDATQERLGRKLGRGAGLRESGMSGGTDAERQDARMVTSSREELETQNVRSRK